jgi:hypothetical protein
VYAQDKEYARWIIDSLTAKGMHGRGYVNNGDKIAAGFISNEFKKSGLESFNDDYFQPFEISINTFPDTVEAWIDDQKLNPGKDFVILSSSPAVKGSFELVWQLADTLGQLPDSLIIEQKDLTDKVIVTNLNQKEFEKENRFGSKGVIFLTDKVWWHISNGTSVKDYFQLQVLKDKIPSSAKTITINARNHFYKKYATQNVAGFISGKHPDSFFVFTAHYDHLGQMGAETWFPGANDNASGTAMLLDLAGYFSLPENRPDRSVAFIAFSAEEVGLLGSEYFAGHPLFPLEKIEFLVNLDMVGSGSEGIKVVNGTIFKKEFDSLVKLNSENEYLLTVSERGEAANSDHYPFYTKGVPCFFIYTLGPECKEYHSIYDITQNVPLTEYEDVFRLLVNFESLFK